MRAFLFQPCHARRMKPHSLSLLLAAATLLPAADQPFVPLFNGRDLNGWVNVNCAPETWSVRDGVIFCTGHPTGALRTPRQYENFILELEWRHLTRGGNSGVFIWASPVAAPGVPFLHAIEVQVLDHGYDVKGKGEWYTTHGDVFPIHGATMKPFGRHNGMRSFPSEERSKGSPEWNHYRVVCNHGVLRLEVNGKEVSGGEECNYRKGYLGLESEGAPVEFRNIRIQELPATVPPPAQAASSDLGWHNLFTGLDLRGWRTNAATATRWGARGEHLRLKEADTSSDATLWTEQNFGDAEFILDCLPAKPPAGQAFTAPALQLRGANGEGFEVKLEDATPGVWQRFLISTKSNAVTVTTREGTSRPLLLPPGTPARGALGLRGAGAEVEFMNLYWREL